MRNSQHIKIRVLGIITFLIVDAALSSVNLLESAKCILQCPSSSLFLYACVVYAVLLEIPYVPGFELGLLLIVYYGKPGILMAYLCTIVGLNLAFFVGKLVSRYWGARFGKTYEQQQTSVEPDTTLVPTSLQTSIAQNRFFGLWIKSIFKTSIHQHQYFYTGILLNMPGNWIIGGAFLFLVVVNALIRGPWLSTSRLWFRTRNFSRD